MKVTQDISLSDFNAWSGARPVLDALIENGHVDDAEAEVEGCFPDGIDATALNDWLWFECEDQHPEWFGEEEEEEEGEEEEEETPVDADGNFLDVGDIVECVHTKERGRVTSMDTREYGALRVAWNGAGDADAQLALAQSVRIVG